MLSKLFQNFKKKDFNLEDFYTTDLHSHLIPAIDDGVKSLDESIAIIKNMKDLGYKKIITIEDGCITGGFGSAVIEFMADNAYFAQIKRLGVPDRFVNHGTPEELWAECGYDKNAVIETIRNMVAEKVS